MPQPIKIDKTKIKGNDALTAYRNLVEEKIIILDAVQEKIAKKLAELGEQLQAYKAKGGLISKIKRKRLSKRGLYIYGDVGRGKSMLMDLFFNTSPIKKKKRVHFHAFMLDVHRRIHDWRQKHQKKSKNADPIKPIAEQIAEEAMLLCFDEFQVQDITDAMILARLFEELFKHGVIFIATSNVKPDKLYEHGLQRDQFLPFIQLLRQQVDITSLASPIDYRLKKLKSVQNLYFTPLGQGAEEFVEKIFADLTTNAIPSPTTLDVNGRQITLEETHGDVARASFQELCGKPLGAADYIEIAREFNTLILTDIPKLSKEKRNEAKRFVTLIDELYEHKVNLICTAEVPPEEIYPKGDGTFEFARTISRLHEMQSDGYLKEGHIS